MDESKADPNARRGLATLPLMYCNGNQSLTNRPSEDPESAY